MPPNQIDSLSRSVGSPALPTAITTRPQLASSPAIAVFTSGELAIDMAMRRAEAFDTAPSTTISTSLRAPSPSRAICSDKLASTCCSALLKSFRRGSRARAIRGVFALPVAKIISVSEVEVSPSMVTALKVSVTPSLSSACKAGAAIAASVKTKESMVAMSGAIMPEPLAMPLTVTVALPMRALAVATLGKVSVVMIAFAADRKSPALARAARPSITGPNLFASSGSPITPVEARKISAGLQPAALAAISAVSRGAAAFPGEGIGVAGIDHQRARFAGFEMGPAPFDWRRRAFRFGEHAGRAGALVEQRQQHVGAPGIADAGLGRGQPHADDRRQVRHLLRGEGGDGGGHLVTLSFRGARVAREPGIHIHQAFS